MNYDEFVNEYIGEGIDYDGVYGVQCVDLTQLYVDKVFDHPRNNICKCKRLL